MGFQCKRDGNVLVAFWSWENIAFGVTLTKWQCSVLVGIAPVRDCWQTTWTMGLPWEKASVMEVKNGARAAWGLWSLRIVHITG